MLSFEQVVAGCLSLTTTLRPIRCDWGARVNEALESHTFFLYAGNENYREIRGNLLIGRSHHGKQKTSCRWLV